MRSFVFILALLTAFQSAIWGMPVSMGAQSDADGVKVMVVTQSTVKMDCQNNSQQTKHMQMFECNNMPYEQMGDCLTQCAVACASIVTLLVFMDEYSALELIEPYISTLSSTFTSYIESPEIQPPLKLS